VLKFCPWFSKLLKGVFVSHVMVLSSAQLNRQNAPAGKVRLNIPTCPVFVQTLYTNVAARLLNHPNVFHTQGLTSNQIIDNRNTAHREIEEAIHATVRRLMPLPDVIESAMNFQGNNPVITARHAAAPAPGARTPTAPGQQGRVSARNFQPKPRLTPPVPARKPGAALAPAAPVSTTAPPSTTPVTRPSSSPAAAAVISKLSAPVKTPRNTPTTVAKEKSRISLPPPRQEARQDEFRHSAISFKAPVAPSKIGSARHQSGGRHLSEVKKVVEQLDMDSISREPSSSSRSSSSSSDDDEDRRERSDRRYKDEGRRHDDDSFEEIYI
jgi:hypothetical protein